MAAVEECSSESEPFHVKLQPGKRRYRGGACCGAINCSNIRAKTLNISFFRFPRDIDRCKRWIINCRRQDLLGKEKKLNRTGVVLCADHFEPSQFMNSAERCRRWVKNSRRQDIVGKEEILYKSGYCLCAEHFEVEQFMNAANRNKLIWNAVPTLFDVPNPPPRLACKRPLPTRHIVEPRPKKSASVKEQAVLLNKDAGKSPSLQGQPLSSSPGNISLHSSNPSHSPENHVVVNGTRSDSVQPVVNRFAKTPAVSVNKLLDEIMELRRQLHRKKPLSLPGGLEVRKRLHKYQVQISRLRRKLSNAQANDTKPKKKKEDIQDIIERSANYLPEKCHALFAAQLRHALVKKPTGARWEQVEKDFAMSMRDISRKAYTFCAGYILLPVPKTVKKWTAEKVDTQLDTIERIVQNINDDSSGGSCFEPLEVCVATMGQTTASDAVVEIHPSPVRTAEESAVSLLL